MNQTTLGTRQAVVVCTLQRPSACSGWVCVLCSAHGFCSPWFGVRSRAHTATRMLASSRARDATCVYLRKPHFFNFDFSLRHRTEASIILLPGRLVKRVVGWLVSWCFEPSQPLVKGGSQANAETKFLCFFVVVAVVDTVVETTGEWQVKYH